LYFFLAFLLGNLLIPIYFTDNFSDYRMFTKYLGVLTICFYGGLMRGLYLKFKNLL